MREILFRGKLISTGEWSEGNLAVHKDGVTIITPDATLLGKYGRVDPETVGQYTGLTDKNGIKIFEGDIIKQYYEDEDSDGEYNYDFFEVGKVFWRKAEAQFLMMTRNPDVCMFINAYCEVIGNIYDNPELLEST